MSHPINGKCRSISNHLVNNTIVQNYLKSLFPILTPTLISRPHNNQPSHLYLSQIHNHEYLTILSLCRKPGLRILMMAESLAVMYMRELLFSLWIGAFGAVCGVAIFKNHTALRAQMRGIESARKIRTTGYKVRITKVLLCVNYHH